MQGVLVICDIVTAKPTDQSVGGTSLWVYLVLLPALRYLDIHVRL